MAREPLGTKGARITSHVTLPGRYLVYMPTESHIGVSRKIESEAERVAPQADHRRDQRAAGRGDRPDGRRRPVQGGDPG